MVVAAELTRLTQKIAILHLVAGSCTIFGSCSRQPVRKPLDTPSYVCCITNYFHNGFKMNKFQEDEIWGSHGSDDGILPHVSLHDVTRQQKATWSCAKEMRTEICIPQLIDAVIGFRTKSN